ncbi:MAG: response regulator [Clostridia bacterium]|nr:response regulator [Clostridia bacterium]
MTTAVISVAVVSFTIYMIAASDRLAAYATNEREALSRSQLSVRDAASALLGIRLQIVAYLHDPQSADSGEMEAQIGALEALNAVSEQAPEPQRGELRSVSRALAGQLERIAASVRSGDEEAAAGIYDGQVQPLFERADRTLQNLVVIEDEQAAAGVKRADTINTRINTVSVLFAAAVVAVTLYISVYAHRAIRRISAEAYSRDKTLGLITDNVDEVLEVYNVRNKELEFVSSNLRRIFGVDPDVYMLHHDMLQEYLDPGELSELSAAYFDPDLDGPRHCEFHYRNPDGRQQIFHSTIYPIRSESDRSTRHVLLTQDVTEDVRIRTELEAALVAAEAANRAKQDFLSRMSHEVRTPINAIIGMEALANSALDDPVRVSHYLQQIGVSARHLLSLVNDLLDMAKIDQKRLELLPAAINLDAMLSDLVMMVSPRIDPKRQTLTVKSRRVEHRHVIGDETRLRQVLLNLLTNANKYTQEGGSITLRVSQEERADGRVDMTFTVTDNGCGISPKDMERIFLPFERAESGLSQLGTGLGLPISRHIVEGMGGKLTAASTVNEGSEFSFTVPLEIDTASEQSADAGPAGARLLVVDDNLINMEIARELLQNAGYEVCEAANGREAVERFAAEPPGTFAAVLMDIQMPVMDGVEAAARLRADPGRLGSTPILAMTADVFSSDENRRLFDDHIAKPFDPQKIIGQIEQARQKCSRRLPGSSDGRTDQTIPD